MTVHSAAFCAILFSGAALFVALPKERHSLAERRELAPWPAFSAADVLSGRFARAIDAHYSDNFVYRESFVEAAAALRNLLGRPDGGMRLFAGTGRRAPEPPPNASAAAPEAKTPPPGRADQPPVGADAIGTDTGPPLPPAVVAPPRQAAPTGAAPKVTAPKGAADYQSIESVIIYRDRAVQIFGGTRQAVQRFATALNRVGQGLGPDVKVYAMAIPVGTDFYLPERVTGGRRRERENIDDFHAGLEPAIVTVDAYAELAERTDDYLFFRTDHHWTGLGAYHAYRAFARAAGFRPLDLSELERRSAGYFLGSMYNRTLSATLRARPDHVDYFVIPNATTAAVHRAGAAKAVELPLYAEYARGAYAYGVFLGGDFPLMHVRSAVGNGRRILVVKDSFGNAFAPFLAAHYDDVYIVDYRYYLGNLRQLVAEQGIGEVLYAHNIFVMNTSYAATQARAMFRVSP